MKIFSSVFFGKIKLIILYLFFLSACIYLILTQMNAWLIEPKTIEIPDIEIAGRINEDETVAYRMYEDLSGFDEALKGVAGEGVQFYGVIIRNLFTFSDPFYHVSFCVYGVEDGYLERLKNNLAIGHIPQAEKKEAVIGGNIARYYQLKVGDSIGEKITLQDDNAFALEGQYVVSGIFDDKDIYFSNGIYISKETFAEFEPEESIGDNMVFLYAEGKSSYKKLTNHIAKIKQDVPIGKCNYYYKTKADSKNAQMKNMTLMFVANLLITGLLFIYITKGITKKISLLKALGISDIYLTTTFCIGFGCIILAACGINVMMAILMLNINILLLLSSVFVIGFIVFLMMLIGVMLVYRKILPRDSMLSQ